MLVPNVGKELLGQIKTIKILSLSSQLSHHQVPYPPTHHKVIFDGFPKALKKKTNVLVIIYVYFRLKYTLKTIKQRRSKQVSKEKTWYGFRNASNIECNVANIRKKIYDEY